MGQGYNVECKNCGYKFGAFLGVGYLYPITYEENVEKMKSGELGQEAKEFFEAFPNGVINCESVVAKCSECGEYEEVYDFTMYRPKAGAEVSDKVSWISEKEINKNYEKYMDYPHKCSSCGGKLKVYKSFEKKVQNGELKCPHCQNLMKQSEDSGRVCWD